MKSFTVIVTSTILLLLCVAAWGETEKDPDLVLATGEHWINASREQKVAYLFGIGNTLEIEQAMHGNNPPEVIRGNSIVPVMIGGLSHFTTTNVREMLDQWYETHPDQLKRPIIEVLYIEFALPNAE